MDQLEVNLNKILTEKETKIVPENIKQGVTCLGVTGTLRNNIKLFETQEAMQADPDAQEGDLAVVYRSEVQNATVDSHFQTATFPDTVVLDTAITDYVDIRYRAVDSSVMFDCMGSLDSSRFMMDCYTNSGEIRIQYTSEDGITYTRTDTTGNPIDFGTEIYYERPEYWNDAIGKFIQVSGSTFEGLFEYSSYKDKTKIKLPLMSGLNIQYDSSSSTISSIAFNKEFSNEINFTKLVSVYNKFISDTSTPNNAYIYLDNNNNLKFVQNCNMLCYDKNVNFLGVSVTISTDTDTTAKIYNIDLENETYTLDTELEPSGYIYGNSNYNWNYYNLNNKTIPFNIVNSKPANFNHICIGDATSSNASYTNYIEENDCYIDTSSYLIAPTQLTAIPEYVYGKEFYGKNGAEQGTLQNTEGLSKEQLIFRVGIWQKYQNLSVTDTDLSGTFWNYEGETIPNIDTSNVTNMNSMFFSCRNLTELPELNTNNVVNMGDMFNSCTNLRMIPNINTSNVTNMSGIFVGCQSLETLPLLDTSNVTNMSYFIEHCTSITSLPLFNTSNVTNMQEFARGCTALKNFPALDISKVTSMYRMFENCESLGTLPLLDTSNITNMFQIFSNCTSLTSIPLWDLSKVKNIESAFFNCSALVDIPQFNLASATNMSYMFYGCTNLSDESLNNILAICISATNISASNKTLKYIRLTSEQATKCTTLSNYNAFTSAGWTTGY